ncbi:MAG: S-layer homology domain-containing protein [Ruminococcaceae bacterium]|nr:S-layer homology domain-containing protein [Oscillospiraceae bacterium]
MKKHCCKRCTSALLCAALLLSSAVSVSSVTQYHKLTYNDNFRDVAKDDWFYQSVADAYSMNIISGVTATEFAPDKTLDLAACIKLACCVHQLKNGGAVTLGNGTVNWYDTYVSYALENGIISEPYEDYTVSASRAQVAVIFSRVLSADEKQINAEAVWQKPFGDVTDPSLWYYGSAYKMYACGIMTGDDLGNFNPEGKIKRSEIAAVVVRLLDESGRVSVSLAAVGTPNPPEETDDTPTTNTDSETDPLFFHKGGTANVPFTGLTGFSLIYGKNGVTGYSTECINDAVLTPDTIAFRLKKDVGLTAMGIVRGWLNNAASETDGVPSSKSAAETKELLDSRTALYINGRKANIASLSITSHDGDMVYTFTLYDSYRMNAVTDIAFICGDIPDEYSSAAKAAVEAAAWGTDAKTGASPSSPSNTGTAATATAEAAAFKNEGYTILFEHKASRLTALYGTRKNGTADEYLLRFIYGDGSVQDISAAKLDDIHVSADGATLYYSIPTPTGDSLEYSISIGAANGNISAAPDNNTVTSDIKEPLKGTLSGLNITISAKDSSLIALMEGENEVLFRGVFSTRATAFSVVTIAPSVYFKNHEKYFGNHEHNRIFALKDGIYYAIIYENTDERTREAAENVINSVVTENAFDCVYTLDKKEPGEGAYTNIFLKDTHEGTLVGDPFLLMKDDTAENGQRIDNEDEAKQNYRISDDTEVWVLAMDYSPWMKTTYGQFRRIWPLGSKWPVWRIVIDPDTDTVTRLVQLYMP